MSDVVTEICFLKDLPLYKQEKPFMVLLPANEGLDPEAFRTNNLEFETRNDILISDIRGTGDTFTLEKSGFELVGHCSNNLDTTSRAQIEAYRAETEKFLSETLGAEKVVCWDVRIRKNQFLPRVTNVIDLHNPLEIEGPAKGAHIDSTIASGPNMVHDHLTEEEKSRFLVAGYRFRVINTWRTVLPVLEDRPLAFCDYRSVDKEDLVACDRVIPTRAGEIYYIRYNSNQRWHWVDHLTSSEMILMLMYDSGRGSQAKFCPHVSFENPNAPAHAPPRHSIETRSVVITKC